MVLDLIVLLIILIAALVGYCRGALRMISGLLAIVLAALIANYTCAPITTYVYKDIIRPQLTEVITTKAEEAGVDTFVKDTAATLIKIQSYLDQIELDKYAFIQDDGTMLESDANIDKELDEEFDVLTDLFGGASPMIIKGIAPNVDTKLLKNIAKAAPSMPFDIFVGSMLSVFEAPIISFITPFCFGIIYVVSLILCNIVLHVVISILDKTPLVGTTIKVLGTIMGGIVGIALGLGVALIAESAIPITSDLYMFKENSVTIAASHSLFRSIEQGDLVDDIMQTVSGASDAISNIVDGGESDSATAVDVSTPTGALD